MLYTKAIEKITFQDVRDFCNQQYGESIHLDYKRDINSSMAKTIAAMANTWGGLIIIGVEEEDSKPKLPVIGIDYKEHLREQINNIILGNIIPPVFPEIQVCESGDKKKAVIVVRVPQSNLTPHAIKNNTKVYLRTDTSNEPEELATIERVRWLVDRREKSSDLKESFYQRAEERYKFCCEKNKAQIRHTEATFSMCPLYPFDVLVSAKKLKLEIIDKIKSEGWGNNWFPIKCYQGDYGPVQLGILSFFNNKSGFVVYTELNEYGFFFHKIDLGRTEKAEDGSLEEFSYLYALLRELDLFLESMDKLYSEIGYWSILELRIKFNKIKNVEFRSLPAPKGRYYPGGVPTEEPIDDSLEFTKILSRAELKEKESRIKLLVDLFQEIIWAIGFSHIKEENIKKLLKENGRL